MLIKWCSSLEATHYPSKLKEVIRKTALLHSDLWRLLLHDERSREGSTRGGSRAASCHYAANTCFWILLFLSSLSCPEGHDEMTCPSVRDASQHMAPGHGRASSPWQRDRQPLTDNIQVTGAAGNTCVPGQAGWAERALWADHKPSQCFVVKGSNLCSVPMGLGSQCKSVRPRGASTAESWLF